MFVLILILELDYCLSMLCVVEIGLNIFVFYIVTCIKAYRICRSNVCIINYYIIQVILVRLGDDNIGNKLKMMLQ